MLTKSLLLAAAVAAFAPTHNDLPDLTIGSAMPMVDHNMPDVVGKEASLKSLMGDNGVLVIFSCNTCPFVVGSEGSAGWEGRYPELGTLCAKSGIGFALVNSNAAKRENGDSFTDMQTHYKEQSYNGHYLLDEKSALADAFGARTTPHVFLFDKNMKLVYKGAIDDNVDDAKAVTKHYLQDAITETVAGKPVSMVTTKNLGCSIKRVAVEHKD
jgi:Redoxin